MLKMCLAAPVECHSLRITGEGLVNVFRRLASLELAAEVEPRRLFSAPGKLWSLPAAAAAAAEQPNATQEARRKLNLAV
jgi:hypothetical protein